MTWLLLDCNFLCHRALHSTGGLTHNGHPTGVLFGFMSELRRLEDRFGADAWFVFAFDHGRGKREQAAPFYKQARREKVRTPEETQAIIDMRRQVVTLKEVTLHHLGHANVFFEDGYEADDVIAAAVAILPPADEAVIVSADKDLYQLLSNRVALYNPAKQGGTFYTARDFKAEFGLHPTQWPEVKAIAGCDTDGVPGVRGVGEATAAKWLAGLSVGTKKAAIEAHVASDAYKTNLSLVTLPYPGMSKLTLLPPVTTPLQMGWDAVCEQWGFDSLRTRRVPLKRG